MRKRLRVNFALEILRSNIQSIRSVSDWSDMMGWDRAEFSRQFAKMYGENAKSAYHRHKLKSIDKFFYAQPNAKYFEIAYDMGFRDEKAFYDYMRYHTTQSPTSYKKELLANEVSIGVETQKSINAKRG
jgi:methylphosphotriester-DNA--protein-cysteine methyltransferase